MVPMHARKRRLINAERGCRLRLCASAGTRTFAIRVIRVIHSFAFYRLLPNSIGLTHPDALSWKTR